MALLCGIFDSLQIKQLTLSDGALREGVLYEMEGHFRHQNIRQMSGTWVFIAEHTPKQRYGLSIDTLTSGITGGILLSAIIIEYNFTEQQIVDCAWRIPFIIGGLFGFISVYLRRSLQETPIFKELAAQKALCSELPVKTILTSHKQACLITTTLT